MEVTQPPRVARPEVDAGPPQWDRYYGPRFALKTRLLLSLILTLPVLYLLLCGFMLIFFEEGRIRAFAFLLFMTLGLPIVLGVWALRDMWLPRRW